MAVETQANEPGFVLAPCPFCGGDAMTYATGRFACCEDDECPGWMSGKVAPEAWNRRPAAAPIVPAPAYGVKALDWEDAEAETRFGSYTIRAAAHFRFMVEFEGCGLPHGSLFETFPEAKAAAQADFERRVLDCLSTHTAAGAGPVGEAVAWRYESIDDDGKVTTHFTDNRNWVEQQRGRGLTPLYARLVEEPGEVERQRGWIYFNPDAGTEWSENHPVESGEVRDAEDIRPGTSGELLKQLLAAWRDLTTETLDRKAADAALAETRERLEKVEAERRDRDSEIVILLANLRHMEEIAGETLEAEDAQMVSDIEAGLSSRRAALSTQESSAALAGDGKEVVR